MTASRQLPRPPAGGSAPAGDTPTAVSRRALLGGLGAAALGAALLRPGTARAASGDGAPGQTFTGVFRDGDPAGVPGAVGPDWGAAPASVMWFDSWGTGNPFPVDTARSLWSQGVMPHYTWEPWYSDRPLGASDQIHWSDINDGSLDSYIAARGREFAAYGAPMLLRFAHEFNGTWYPWAVSQNGQDAGPFVTAWRRVHDIVSDQGASNVQWVWAFNNGSAPDTAWNAPAAAYPGAAYVDWVGVDAYNWGASPSWDPGVDHWASFADSVGAAYSTARAVDRSKPVVLGELGCSEDGGDKGAWIRAMDDLLYNGRHPNLKLLTWFDVDKEERWSIDSSSGSHQAWVDMVARGRYRGAGTQLAGVAPGYPAVAD